MEICSTWPAYTPDSAYEADASVLGLLVRSRELAAAGQGDGHGWA